ncbi:MAG: GAF domain-containing protein, partial [Deltaproteobacteria bacterium]|nr:GAF domain-containing protein [Deltaproteobacteria bacterium]
MNDPILFERHPLPMWVFDPQSLRILAANDAAVDRYGYSRDEFLSMTVQDIRPPEEVPALLEHLRRQRQATPRPVQGRTESWVHRKKDGTLLDTEVSWSRISFQGKAAVLVMANDITERRKHQAEIQRHLDRLRILHEISAAVTTTLDLNTVLEFFLRKANRLLPYSVFTIRLWNEERKVLEPVICHNLNEKEWKAQSGIGGGLTAVPFETNEPVAVTRIDLDPRAGRPVFARKHGLVSYLGVPLSVKGEVIGVLSAYTKEEHQFSREEIEFFSTLASQVAFAIHNAKIYDQAQQALKRMHALYEINAAIGPLLEVGAVLDTLLQKAAGLLPYGSVTIRLLDKATGKLDAAACWNIDAEEWKSEEANPPHGFASAVFE